MASISLKVSDMEKKFLQSMAQFEGVTLSELIKSKVFDSLEDEYDAKIADLRLSEYESYLKNGGEVLKWEELYKIIPTPHFVKDFSKLDEFVKKRIKIYLENVAEDPRSKGKMLKANRKGHWRYRIGNYRVIVNIQDENLVVLALEVGHRKNIYNS